MFIKCKTKPSKQTSWDVDALLYILALSYWFLGLHFYIPDIWHSEPICPKPYRHLMSIWMTNTETSRSLDFLTFGDFHLHFCSDTHPQGIVNCSSPCLHLLLWLRVFMACPPTFPLPPLAPLPTHFNCPEMGCSLTYPSPPQKSSLPSSHSLESFFCTLLTGWLFTTGRSLVPRLYPLGFCNEVSEHLRTTRQITHVLWW